MKHHVKKRLRREIAAIASLKDSDIDISAIPEITDWTGAVVGRFFRPKRTGILGLHDVHFDASAINSGKSVSESEVWVGFVRRWCVVTRLFVSETATLWGASSEVIENLTRSVFMKLMENEFELLKRIEPQDDMACTRFLRRFSAKLVSDHFKQIHEGKREPIRNYAPLLKPAGGDALDEFQNIFVKMHIDSVLAAIASEQEREIFWLHYGEGIDVSEIAARPTIRLSKRRVKQILSQLAHLMRIELVQSVVPFETSITDAGGSRMQEVLERLSKWLEESQSSSDLSTP